jgi:ATP phosphoribosyltransferase
MTQQNAALVEESAASAKTLLEQARGMRQRMTYFKIDGHETVSMQAERVKADFVARTTPKPAPRTVAPRKAAAAAPVAVVASEDDGWEDF